MLQHYGRIRTDAKQRALEEIIQPVFEGTVHQNSKQIDGSEDQASAKLVN